MPGEADESGGQAGRRDEAVEAGGEGAEELARQAAERPARQLRGRPHQPTPADVTEHEQTGHEPYRSWCRACVAGRGRADAHVARPAGEKGLPVIGVDYGYLWSRSAENTDEAQDEIAGADPPDGVRASSPVLCGRCSTDRWLFGHLCQSKGDNDRNRSVLAKELTAGGYPRVIVRSDGEPAMLAHVRAARVVATLDGVPLEVVQEQVSKSQSPGNGLAEGAVKELKAKIRTLRHCAEEGLARLIPEDHDVLAWLVQHAAATVNWFRPGTDGKTPYELRYGKKMRRPVAPFGQKVWWMSAQKHVSRIGSESRWQEGIFLGIFGVGMGAADYAIGTPEGVKAGRAIKLVPEVDAWDVELLLAVKGLPWDRRRADPSATVRLPITTMPAESMLPPPPCAAPVPNARRVYIRKDVEIRKYGVTLGCPGCMAITAGGPSDKHNDECRSRVEQLMREDAEGGGADRIAEADARKKGSGVAAEEEAMMADPFPGGDEDEEHEEQEPRGEVRAAAAAGASGIQKKRREAERRGEVRGAPAGGAASGSGEQKRMRAAEVRGQVRHSPETPLAGREASEAERADQREVARSVGEINQHLLELGYLEYDRVDVSEIFSPGRFAEVASAFDLVPGTAFDIRTGWDLATPAGRGECWRTLLKEMPEVVIGSPVCSPFSILQGFNDPSRRREALKVGIRHMEFSCAVYKWQLERGAHFLHEHPWGASSWKLQCVQQLVQTAGVEVVRSDQCQFGQLAWHKLPSGEWERRPARKRTGFMTSMELMARALENECPGDHEHARMLSGTAKPTERYPPELVATILRTIVKHLRQASGIAVDALEVGIGPHIDHDIKEVDFEEVRVPTQKFYDQYTGMELDPEGVRAARQDEMDFAKKLEAFEPRPLAEAWEKMGRRPFGVRWIDSNKGDAKRPELRSRMVVQETRRTSTIAIEDIASVTSSTPPLEVVRLFCSLMMSMTGAGGEPLVMQFLDVSRAHPHCKSLRDDFYVQVPAEMGLEEGMCLLVKRSWYGMRDAGQAFEFAVRDNFVSNEFRQGMFSPCVYRHDKRMLLYFVHGDDYVGIGVRSDVDWYLERVRERFIIKERGVLGPGGVNEMRILNRVISYFPAGAGTPEMITYEADQRHADLLVTAYGLDGNSNPKKVPWDKPSFMTKNPMAGPMLGGERLQAFRSACMRCLFLAIDRPDIQFVAKEISRAMANPTVNADETLKGVARYLVGHPRVVWRYPRQAWPGKILGMTDSNWAACPVTRKSTSATYLAFGAHPVYTASSTQTILALSSGEAEFYAAVRCACRTIGLKSLMADFDLAVEADIVTDSSACKGLASRRGAGKVRHIHCPALWLQHAIARRQLAIVKRAGKDLPPDIGTKASITADAMWRLLGSYGVVLEKGRAKESLEAATAKA